MKTKICTKCKIKKELSKFYTDNTRTDKKYLWCKDCVLKENKRYNLEHPEIRKQYLEKNKEKYKKIWKKYREAHKEERKKYQDIYRVEHKEYYQKHNKKYHKQRRKTDIIFKISGNLRTRLNKAVVRESKSTSVIKLTGCSIEFLKKYLESQFKKNMTWDNYGTGNNGRGMKEWHIDHIKPCISFDLSKESEQQKCFHYTNLQPLWAKDNLEKGKKNNG